FEKNHFVLVGSPTGRDGSIVINQDVDMYAGKFKTKMDEQVKFQDNRTAWIQVVKGKLNVSGHTTKGVLLEPGDGLAITDEKNLDISSHGHAEFLLFDMPKV